MNDKFAETSYMKKGKTITNMWFELEFVLMFNSGACMLMAGPPMDDLEPLVYFRACRVWPELNHENYSQNDGVASWSHLVPQIAYILMAVLWIVIHLNRQSKVLFMQMIGKVYFVSY